MDRERKKSSCPTPTASTSTSLLEEEEEEEEEEESKTTTQSHIQKKKKQKKRVTSLLLYVCAPLAIITLMMRPSKGDPDREFLFSGAAQPSLSLSLSLWSVVVYGCPKANFPGYITLPVAFINIPGPGLCCHCSNSPLARSLCTFVH